MTAHLVLYSAQEHGTPTSSTRGTVASGPWRSSAPADASSLNSLLLELKETSLIVGESSSQLKT